MMVISIGIIIVNYQFLHDPEPITMNNFPVSNYGCIANLEFNIIYSLTMENYLK
jgi:hypothetical protein